MGEKETFLVKLNMKDYKNELELVLEKKQFDEEAKSLLLSIFYKIDNFYKDYVTVKKDSEIKNQYLENYIDIIKTKCKIIHLIKPKDVDEKKKYEVNKKNGEIKCVPNELILLYAINELSEKNIIKEKFLLEDFTQICVNNLLNKGKTINQTEIVRDFNGWSWSMQIDYPEYIIHNLIFQNLLILFGYQYINENINKHNIIDILRNKLIKDGYGELGNRFIENFLKICIALYNNASKENHEKCLKYKNNIISRKNMLKSRKGYVEDKNKDSSKLSIRIRKIDNILNDINLIRSEYEKSLNENKNKYFCISDFVESKELEKEELLEKIKNNNKVLSEKKYLNEHESYEFTIELYDMVDEKKQSINIQPIILNFQKIFLECIKFRIEKLEQKKELFSEVVRLRYYSNLFIKKDKNIISQEKLQDSLESVFNVIINKMQELKMVDTGFKSNKLNCQILKYIFKTKIIELENLSLKINFISNNQIEVEYYDSKTLENRDTFDIPFEEEVTNRKSKRIKIFKIGG